MDLTKDQENTVDSSASSVSAADSLVGTAMAAGPAPLTSKRKKLSKKYSICPDEAFQALEHQCRVCFAEFGHIAALSAHQKAVHGSAALFTNLSQKCDVCPADFRTIHDLLVHARQHTLDPAFKCDRCIREEARAEREAAAKDAAGHSDTAENEFNCAVCRGTFVSAHNLAIHMQIHNNDE